MSSDNQLDNALRALAGQGGQGRVPAAADIRRRGDTRRRRRTASVALAALAVVALGAGVALVRPGGRAHPIPVGPAGPTSGPVASPDPAGASSGPTGGTSNAAGPSSVPTGGASGPPTGSSSPPAGSPLLSGQRQVTIVRVDALRGGLSLLDDGRLGEVDGDEGQQLFVFTPQGSDTYQIRTAEPGTDRTDTCWQVRSSGSQPLRVEAAPCAPDEPRQQFTVVRDGQHDGAPTYAISSHSAFLQNSRTRGLILEELGDAPLTTRFRLVDNGPASQ
ncbi:hypothetical protein [Micromonospora sp. KC723]|uniref:hypothetical protein n=1 Tax=Micromonospora sp. KC723 TaxID=2530381 RepID=UPI00104C1052|nr:hypothetical protein [Micromonospora sp. KC723]TDB78323.1 hypothetical protein E1165_01290 [Micromonospora sp. KC723]